MLRREILVKRGAGMPEGTPATVVRAQVDAYNGHDVDDFLSYYADDAVVFGPDGQALVAGRDAMRETFGELFARMPDLRAEVPAVIEVGEWVGIHSVVRKWRLPDDTVEERQWIEVYRVVDGKITELRLFR
jgi:hypothetical protein